MQIGKFAARATVLVWLCQLSVATAADISRDVRGAEAETGSFLEMGFGIGLERIPIAGYDQDSARQSDIDNVDGQLGVFLDTRLQWNGLFVELFHDSFALATLGYNAWSNNAVEFDLILTSTLGEIDPGFVQGFETVQDRDAAVEGGLRTIVYDGPNIIQFEAITDLSNVHDGFSASWQLGRHWQLRNWSTHALFGLRYFSEDMLDYYFGVSTSEASSENGLAAYQASDAVLASLGVGASRPINEKWIFRSSATAYLLPDSIADSPLVTERVAWQAGVKAVYVF